MNEKQMQRIERLQENYANKLDALLSAKSEWQAQRSAARRKGDSDAARAASDEIAFVNVKIQQVTQFIWDLDSLLDLLHEDN